MSNIVDNLVKEISKLTLVEASQLADSLKKELNIPDAPAFAAPAIASSDANADQAKDAKSSKFSLILTSAGEKKIAAVKALKSIFKKLGQELGLQDIKKKVDNLPCEVAVGLSKEDADQYASELKEAGCQYELKEN